jgi:hypothetical protein
MSATATGIVDEHRPATGPFPITDLLKANRHVISEAG